ncbi:DUF4468 domain-containing protein [Spirosoma sp. RP8]|uniref:DUF4468 domain-containing protein n=1 Tax=Spirosoma liriopis TaxID=2937440 RepID=A0ABT0HQQ4_9BACT|nr:DUF4468 domain-containing protein [Spirosoma liriopis]MCK8493973.1 DUF4468 domain-containing protein [Spirosoma liriopis]
MKKWLFVAFCLLAGHGYSQKRTYSLADMPFELDSASGGIVYRGMVEVPGVMADQLYLRARSSLQNLFPKDNQVIKSADQAKGLVTGKGRLFIPITNSQTEVPNSRAQAYYEVPVEIQVKNGLFKYRIASISIVNRGLKTSLDREVSKSAADMRQHVLSEYEYQRSLRSVQPFVELINALKQRMIARSDTQ